MVDYPTTGYIKLAAIFWFNDLSPSVFTYMPKSLPYDPLTVYRTKNFLHTVYKVGNYH